MDNKPDKVLFASTMTFAVPLGLSVLWREFGTAEGAKVLGFMLGGIVTVCGVIAFWWRVFDE